jgi:hypothetical protein
VRGRSIRRTRQGELDIETTNVGRVPSRFESRRLRPARRRPRRRAHFPPHILS